MTAPAALPTGDRKGGGSRGVWWMASGPPLLRRRGACPDRAEDSRGPEGAEDPCVGEGVDGQIAVGAVRRSRRNTFPDFHCRSQCARKCNGERVAFVELGPFAKGHCTGY